MTDMDNYDSDAYVGDEFGADGDGGWDEAEGFTVNMSEKEAGSEVRVFQVAPAGFYRVKVDEVDLEEVKGGKNKGKPMFNFKLIVIDGDFVGRAFYNRICLFDGALYTISQAMKAQGLPVNEGNLRIPPAKWWQGKEMLAQVKVVNKQVKGDEGTYVNETDENGKLIKTNDVGGYKATPTDWDPTKMSPKKPGTKGAAEQAAKNAVDTLAP
jgi:hypothetical protein